MRNRIVLLIALAVSALVAAAVATAHTSGGAQKAGDARSAEAAQRHYTAADQKLARAVVLKATDLGSASHWSGGVTAADTTQPRSCSNFHPRQSDLVITGDAQSDFTPTTGGLEYHNEAQIMQNAKMVRLDWQRNVLDPAALSCLRTFFVKNLVGGQQLVSLAPLAVPHIATYTAGYRALVDQSGVRNMIDVIFVGRSRTEITLEISAPYSARAKVEQSERHLAKLLVARAPAH
jgi:hypothetical protein